MAASEFRLEGSTQGARPDVATLLSRLSRVRVLSLRPLPPLQSKPNTPTNMLFSTKRKWDKLINAGSGNTPGKPTATPPKPAPAPTEPTSPTPNAPSTPTTPVLDPKKRRVADISVRPSVRAVSPTDSVLSTRSARSAFSTVTTTSRAAGTYAPWDRDAFLERLGSFRYVDRWTAKPNDVNEVAWARRGWVCYDKNRVRCVTCRKDLLVKVELDDEQSDAGRAVVEHYKNAVVDEHDESCAWRRRGCDDSIYRLQLSNASVARPAFAERYSSLVKIRNEIPPSLSYPEGVDPAALHYPSECTDEGPIFETAAMLALFGWHNEDPGIPSLVTCSACFRRLGLWLFRKKPKVDEPDASPDEASVCRLDLVGEHRDYCPWVNAVSQGKEPGWKTMHRVLQNSPRGMSSAASVYSVATVTTDHSDELTDAARDAEDNSKLQRLRRLKTLYFGKKKKDIKKDKDNQRENSKETTPAA
ncbi:C3HC zinc finger-like-domain-containing protein [Sphaerosporella brunnea]|uniref:C3HC zinc finger-like-domain-containing protein n=1 Tax=Sphaerosporella brunnea TaxID=1250544 RepID=A0A5J5F1T0_9PEZI|nr:C3HC zinc finger-like-domain-containing protein [Sphaerosporella brunnea]